MTRPARLTALVAGLALTAGLLSPSGAAPAPQARPSASKIVKLNWPGHTLVHGEKGSVRGKVPGRKRTVVLEQLLPNRGWARVDRDRTSKKGTFKLRVPTSWYHGKMKHRVRIVGGPASRTRGVSVRPSYNPVGKASFWRRVQKGRNWQYNPCRPVTFRANTAAAPAGALDHLAEAVRRLEVATGINFVYRGATTNSAGNHKRWPKRTNLVVVWHTRKSSPIPLANHSGRGGPFWGKWMSGAKGRVAATIKSRVIMNSDVALPPGFSGTSLGMVLMHELGHAAGLGHVLDHPGQVMSYDIGSNWQAGDLAGLRRVGKQGGCLTPYRGHGRVAVGGIEGPTALD